MPRSYSNRFTSYGSKSSEERNPLLTGGDGSGDPIEDAPRFNEEVLSAEDRRQMNRRYELQVIALSQESYIIN